MTRRVTVEAARASRKMHSDIPVVRSELVATRKRKTHAAEPVAPVTRVNNA